MHVRSYIIKAGQNRHIEGLVDHDRSLYAPVEHISPRETEGRCHHHPVNVGQALVFHFLYICLRFWASTISGPGLKCGHWNSHKPNCHIGYAQAFDSTDKVKTASDDSGQQLAVARRRYCMWSTTMEAR